MTCPSCGNAAPGDARFCPRCGQPLAEGARRRGFSAAPHEHARIPRALSTLFPHLPRGGHTKFRIAIVGGVVLVATLEAFKYLPLAIVSAAALVPILVVAYLYDVDIYEDEPLPVLLGTVAWGIAAGIGVGIGGRAFAPATAVGGASGVLLHQGVVLPLLQIAAALIGPLVLISHPKFNDVLDGATFGVTSGATIAGVAAIITVIPLFRGGLRPFHNVLPYLPVLFTIAIARPLLLAALAGGAAGAVWLRYRAPARDRQALGPLGHPVVALSIVTGGQVLAGIAQVKLPGWPGTLIMAVAALTAIAWLRLVIHVGLMEESREGSGYRPEVCPNCGHPSAGGSYCANCGIAFLATPKQLRTQPT